MSNQLTNTDIKVTILGNSSVGKTSLTRRIVFDNFEVDTTSTIGAAFCSFNRIHEDHSYNFKMWDTAGQERFKTMVPMYLRGSQIVLMVFDLTDRNSYEDVINFWYNEVKKHQNDAVIILIGNKLDLVKLDQNNNTQNTRKIRSNEAKYYADIQGIKYIECSAKDKDNLDQIVDLMVENARIIYENNKEITPEDIFKLYENEETWKDKINGWLGNRCY